MPRDGEDILHGYSDVDRIIKEAAALPLPEFDIAKVRKAMAAIYGDAAPPVRHWQPAIAWANNRGRVYEIQWSKAGNPAEWLKASPPSQKAGRKILADALIKALQLRADSFSLEQGLHGYLCDEDAGQRWDLEWHDAIEMDESANCSCQNLDLGRKQSKRVWKAIKAWRRNHGDYSAHAEEAGKLDQWSAAEETKDPSC